MVFISDVRACAAEKRPAPTKKAEVQSSRSSSGGGRSTSGGSGVRSSGGSGGGGKNSYQNCTDVWNTIGRPINRGEPGYARKLDRDNDGVGCEYDPR